MRSERLAITGATGNLGGRVARALANSAPGLRLVVRDPNRAPDLPDTEIATASYDDRDAARDALRGISTLFMVSGAESPHRVEAHTTFIDAAVEAGVQHIVYTSFFGAATNSAFTLGRDHWATEEHLRASGLRWTMLRDSLYADFLPSMVGADGTLRGPAADGRLAAVAIDDVADVAVQVLRDPARHEGLTYELTGPDAMTLAEVAITLTTATGRSVTYVEETLEEAYASRAAYGAPDWQVEAWVSTYVAIARGELAGRSDAVATVAGHPATSLPQLLARRPDLYAHLAQG